MSNENPCEKVWILGLGMLWQWHQWEQSGDDSPRIHNETLHCELLRKLLKLQWQYSVYDEHGLFAGERKLNRTSNANPMQCDGIWLGILIPLLRSQFNFDVNQMNCWQWQENLTAETFRRGKLAFNVSAASDISGNRRCGFALTLLQNKKKWSKPEPNSISYASNDLCWKISENSLEAVCVASMKNTHCMFRLMRFVMPRFS